MNKNVINPKGGNKNRVRKEETLSTCQVKGRLTLTTWNNQVEARKEEIDVDVRVDARTVGNLISQIAGEALKSMGDKLSQEEQNGDGDGFEDVQ